MQHVFRWRDLIETARMHFPEINENLLILAEDDIGKVIREIARAHDLTLAEAAEMATWRLPQYQPDDYQVRLSA